MRVTALTLICLAVLPVRAETLTLADAQARLFKNNLDVLTAEVELRQARNELSGARRVYFPSLDAHGSYSYMTEKNWLHLQLDPGEMFPGSPEVDVDKAMGSNDRADFGVDFTCPFFTGFSRRFAVRSGREAVAAREAALDAVKNRVSFALGLLYFQWQLSFKEADLRKTLVDQLDTHARQVAARREAGAALQSTLLDAQARLQLARADLVIAENRTDSLRREIMFFILSKDPSIVPDTAAGAAFDTLPVPKSVKTERPELVALDHAAAEINEMRTALRYRHFPSLYGIAGLRYGRPGLYMGLDQYMGYGLLGLQLKWNLFDGFKKQTKDALLQRRIDLIDIKRTRRVESIGQAFERAKKQVTNATERLAACRTAFEAARALTADLRNAVAAGTATNADYLNALANEAQAGLMVEQAKTAKKSALLSAWYAAGKVIKY